MHSPTLQSKTALAALRRGVPSVRVCAPADLGGDGGTVVTA